MSSSIRCRPLSGERSERTLWLSPEPFPAPPGHVVVVLDAAWSPGAGDPGPGDTSVISVRGAIGRVLAAIDPIEASSDLLDDWAEASGVAASMTIGQTSFWYTVRLRHWLWLQERVLWAHVLRDLVAEHRPAVIGWREGADAALVDVARLVAAADGLGIDAPDEAPAGTGESAITDAADPRAQPPPAVSLRSRSWRRFQRVIRPWAPPPTSVAWLRARLEVLAAEGGHRLLAIHSHAPQVVGSGRRARLLNPYLGPVEERLRGTRLEPIVLEWRLRRRDADAMYRIASRTFARVLPFDAIALEPVDEDGAAAATKEATLTALRAIAVPVPVAGIDLGAALVADVVRSAEGTTGSRVVTIARCVNLIRTLRPSGILIADEYHRQDWMEAAARTGTPIAAIQHGTIYRHHRGYIHRSRPPELRLVDRTYVFGAWERERLVCDSVYRPEEVVVAGSPRLDLVPTAAEREDAAERAAVRRELRVAKGDRLVVLSGTWGGIYRRFHYPVVLARLFDRPLPRVHLVVKLHPAETDEGPYRAVVESAAVAGGFTPPPVTVVQRMDLYRLLAAADAHLGIHSTVLTEAVFVGTPNLLAAGIEGGDLLDYVPSGVAIPVRDGGDLLAALDAAADGAITPEAQAAFIARHYEPGDAAERIARDLLDWLPAG